MRIAWVGDELGAIWSLAIVLFGLGKGRPDRAEVFQLSGALPVASAIGVLADVALG